ncbi:MAG TPA: hypothetical protein VEU30_16100 [Thermoanaerobaculia bacterium]|nr:hypothetical protein [Thermoanaerobaculia bacterium]
MKRSLSVLAILTAAVVILYRKSVRLYWTYDDPWFLHVALMRRWTEGFTHADIWRQNLFTPLLTSTFELFAATLWLEPRRWYAAQLVLLVALAFAVYAALRVYVDAVPAGAGALLFLIGPPLVNVASHLGVIHYVEALLFLTLSFIAFAKGRGVLSAFLYLMAMLAKEIAVPFSGLLLLLGGPRRVIPHAIALAVYAAWRLLVIGLPVTGYGWEVEARDVLAVPWKLVTLFGALGALLLGVMAVVVARGLKTRRQWLIGAVGLVLAIAPILPVSKEMAPRFALLPWLWLCAGFAFGAASLKRRELVLGATIVLAVIVNRRLWSEQYTLTKRMSEEARVWVHERGDILLRNPAIPAGTMPELEWLKEDYFPHAEGARWFYDDLYLCTHPLAGRRILEYDPRSRLVEEVTLDAERICAAIREDVPMTLAFERRGDAMHWRFGPYTAGTWRLILNEGEEAWDVPRESAYRIGTATRLSLRIGYRSPEGWTTYSPPIALDFARQTRTTWHR